MEIDLIINIGSIVLSILGFILMIYRYFKLINHLGLLVMRSISNKLSRIDKVLLSRDLAALSKNLELLIQLIVSDSRYVGQESSLINNLSLKIGEMVNNLK